MKKTMEEKRMSVEGVRKGEEGNWKFNRKEKKKSANDCTRIKSKEIEFN